MSTLIELWRESTTGTSWSQLDLERELENVEKLAVRPRIPDDHLIFRIFRAFPKPEKNIRVVLLGQDPYPEIFPHDESPITRACGFSFSSPLGNLPLSLRTIISEILREFPQEPIEHVDLKGKKTIKPAIASDYSGDLSYLVADGVFLLNTYLTVKVEDMRGKPASHTSWLSFTTRILNFIRRSNPNVVYLALGKKAVDLLKDSGVRDAIECDHPANIYGGSKPFAGSNIFIQANALLTKRKLPEIKWIPMRKAVDTEYYSQLIIKPNQSASEPIVLEEIVEQVSDDESEPED